MATLTVRNLAEGLVRRLRIRAAEHGRSAGAEHREILRAVLIGGEPQSARAQAAARLEEFRRRTASRDSAMVAELLEDSRMGRTADLDPGGRSAP